MYNCIHCKLNINLKTEKKIVHFELFLATCLIISQSKMWIESVVILQVGFFLLVFNMCKTFVNFIFTKLLWKVFFLFLNKLIAFICIYQ